MNPDTEPRPPGHGPLIAKCLLAVAGATLFAFALVPLYRVLCEVTGLNGKTTEAVAQNYAVDTSRWITVEFTGTAMASMPWEMRPKDLSLRVHPGELTLTSYRVKNPTNADLVSQAVPSVSPSNAAAHLKKIECFCFTQQTIRAGETREMPLVFVISPDLPRNVTTITLSYAFFQAPTPKLVTIGARGFRS